MDGRTELPPGATLCGIIGWGVPMSIDFVGPHTFSNVGPILGALAVLGAATFWLFRRYGGDAGRTTLRPEISEAMWAELEQQRRTADEAAGQHAPDPDVEPEPVAADMEG